MPNHISDGSLNGIIDPRCIYRVPAFRKYSGLGHTTETTARKKGIFLKKFHIGRCYFVRGSDAIDYINQLAELEEAK